jgi:hypothetical protein
MNPAMRAISAARGCEHGASTRARARRQLTDVFVAPQHPAREVVCEPERARADEQREGEEGAARAQHVEAQRHRGERERHEHALHGLEHGRGARCVHAHHLEARLGHQRDRARRRELLVLVLRRRRRRRRLLLRGGGEWARRGRERAVGRGLREAEDGRGAVRGIVRRQVDGELAAACARARVSQ